MQVGIYDDESKRCSFDGCEQVDILAVRCSHCGGMFCCDHTAASAHKCTTFDAKIITCPLCRCPVLRESTAELPDEAVSRHMDSGCCPALRPIGKEERRNYCSYGDCTKNEYASIICEGCKNMYCVEHRSPANHACRATRMRPSVTSPRTLSALIAVPASSMAPLATSSLSKYTPRNTPSTAFGRPTEGAVTPLIIFAEEFDVAPFFMHFPSKMVMGRLLDLAIGQATLDSAGVSAAKGVWVAHVLQQSRNTDGFSLSAPPLSSTLREVGVLSGTLVYVGKQQVLPRNVLKELQKLPGRKMLEKERKKGKCSFM